SGHPPHLHSFPTRRSSDLPQTGFADWNQDFPNPSDFYLLLDAKSIQQTNNQNFSQVNDPKVQSELTALNKVPATQLQSAASRWRSEEHTSELQSRSDLVCR